MFCILLISNAFIEKYRICSTCDLTNQSLKTNKTLPPLRKKSHTSDLKYINGFSKTVPNTPQSPSEVKDLNMNSFLKFLIQAALHIHLNVHFQKTLTSDTKVKQLRRERAIPELLFLAYCHSGHSRLRPHRGPICKTLDPLFP